MTNTNRKYYQLQSVLHKHINRLPTLNLQSVAKKIRVIFKGAGGQKKVLKCNNVQPHFHPIQQMCSYTAISFPMLPDRVGPVMCIALYRVLTRPEATTFTQKAKCGTMQQTDNQ